MSPTKTKPKAATFRSTDNTLRLVRIAQQRRMNDRGEWETSPGHTVEFHDGLYSTDDSDVLKFLRDHDQKDSLFVEVGKEPGRPLPETSDLIEAVVDAVADKNKEKLAEIYLQERNSHSRPEVLKAAAAGLEKLKADLPDPDPVPEHELVRTRAPGVVGAQPGEDAPKAEK